MIKDDKIVKNQDGGLKVPLFDPLVPKHQPYCPLQHTTEQTKPQTHKDTCIHTTDIQKFIVYLFAGMNDNLFSAVGIIIIVYNTIIMSIP